MPKPRDPNLLVGAETSDDAGVYRIGPDRALVQTLDFFPPIVDDPRAFGRIAAANALSDVYAMGGTPLTAMNIVAWPSDLELEVLAEVLRGGQEKLDEAGCVLVGGHTVTDKEVKYGMSVTGMVDPVRMTTNRGARPGDRLVLTKPLGTGVVTTAWKAGKATESEMDAAVASMSALNRKAAEALAGAGVRCATDVTGFGLLGHASHIARESEVGLRIRAGALPLLPGAARLAGEGVKTGAAGRTRTHLGGLVSLHPGLEVAASVLVFDAETSGGLLAAVAPDRVPALLAALRAAGTGAAAEIGEVVAAGDGAVRLEVLP